MKQTRYKDMFAERITDRKSIPIACFLLVMVLGYGLFFTSKMWFPSSGNLVEATPYYQRVSYGSYEIYLTEWKYSESQDAMQVILELENKDILDLDFTYQVVERSDGELRVNPVLKSPDYVVLRVENIPKDWKEISLRIGEEGEENPAKFYTNAEEVKQAGKLPKLTEKGYQAARLQGQMDYDAVLLQGKEREMKTLEEENRRLAQKIQELEEGTYLSEQEVRQAEETILKAKNQIQLNADDIRSIEKEAEELRGRSEAIQAKIEELGAED